MSGTEDADLWQADHQSPGHGGLVVVPATDRTRNIPTDDGAGGGEAIVWQKHAAGLQLQLERWEESKEHININAHPHGFLIAIEQ